MDKDVLIGCVVILITVQAEDLDLQHQDLQLQLLQYKSIMVFMEQME